MNSVKVTMQQSQRGRLELRRHSKVNIHYGIEKVLMNGVHFYFGISALIYPDEVLTNGVNIHFLFR